MTQPPLPPPLPPPPPSLIFAKGKGRGSWSLKEYRRNIHAVCLQKMIQRQLRIRPKLSKIILCSSMVITKNSNQSFRENVISSQSIRLPGDLKNWEHYQIKISNDLFGEDSNYWIKIWEKEREETVEEGERTGAGAGTCAGLCFTLILIVTIVMKNLNQYSLESVILNQSIRVFRSPESKREHNFIYVF